MPDGEDAGPNFLGSVTFFLNLNIFGGRDREATVPAPDPVQEVDARPEWGGVQFQSLTAVVTEPGHHPRATTIQYQSGPVRPR
jgi:hypothetical protein